MDGRDLFVAIAQAAAIGFLVVVLFAGVRDLIYTWRAVRPVELAREMGKVLGTFGPRKWRW
jgi:hypothetical protein